MRQRWYVRAALAAVVGLGVAASLARAQEPPPGVVIGPEPWALLDSGAWSPTPPPPDTPPLPRKGPIRDWVRDCGNKIGVCCWSHHNAFTCSSWKSEGTFIFGGCRQFFGETCLQGPPQPPFPPGYGPLPGYGPVPGYGSPGYGEKAGCPNCQ
ncbi:MAG TPA: hypothetical protein VKA46_33310 [Gemmataceae bacterium]|nr:hypothetical protein [Gemmataceae bacterium]